MKTKIFIQDLEALALGAAILGSGGGGSPDYNKLITKNQIEKYGPINVLQLEDLSEDDLIVPVGFMGAPLIGVEKLPSLQEFKTIIENIEKFVGKKPTVLLPTEIGGGNAFAPLMIAGMLNMPVLDADLLGRAFPEIQMSSANLSNVSATPAFIADSLGNCSIMLTNDTHMLESMARNITMSFGSSAALAMSLMNAQQARNAVIRDSLSRSLEIGNCIVQERENNGNPIESLVKNMNAYVVGSGVIADINQAIKKGFLQGTVLIEDENVKIAIAYQNENLIVHSNDQMVACTPDIIIPLDSQTGMPITSEILAYGLRVTVLVFPSPAIWQTPQGLAMVGPRYFGYDCDYTPIDKRF